MNQRGHRQHEGFHRDRCDLRACCGFILLFLLGAVAARAQAPEVETIRKQSPFPSSPQIHTAASPNFDATYYHLTLDIRFDPPGLVGHTLIEGNAAGSPLSTLRLDFHRAMQVDSVHSAEGAPLAFTHADDVLEIDLPQPAPVGESVSVRVFYHGLPEPGDFGAFVFDTTAAGQPVAWSLSEPYGARRWFPAKDHPSDKADSVRVTATVPRPMRVGANGLIEATTFTEHTATYDWFSRYPIAPYLISVAVAEYEVREYVYHRPDSLAAQFGPLALPMLDYAYPANAAAFFAGWEWVLKVFPVLESWFGPYPFAEEKYGHAQMTRGGGMEHQTMSSMGGHSLDLVVHELAHQWFGDLLTNRTWADLWLNEGFATYAQALYWQHHPDPQWWPVFRSITMQRARNAVGIVARPDTLDLNDLFSHRTYSKGAIVLHMLRGLVGDAAFRQMLRTYTGHPDFRFATVNTEDFQQVAEAVSGLDLDGFFEQWLYRSGYPVYEVDWHAAETSVAVTIRQVQSQPVFVMPVMLEVEDAQSERHRFTVENTQREQTFVLDVPQPVAVTLDPEQWILRNETVPVQHVSSEPASRPGRTRLLPPFPNPARDEVSVPIELAKAGTVRMEVLDVLGRRVLEVAEVHGIGTHTVALRLNGLPAGTYFLRLRFGAQIEMQPFVLTR